MWVMPIVNAPGLPVTANERAALYGITGGSLRGGVDSSPQARAARPQPRTSVPFERARRNVTTARGSASYMFPQADYAQSLIDDFSIKDKAPKSPCGLLAAA